MSVMLETPSELFLRNNFYISAKMMEGLNRINQVGAEHAQRSLEGFLGHEECVGIETISILPLTMLAQRLRTDRREYLGCHIRIFGELQAELYCYLQSCHARSLVGAVLRHQKLSRTMGPLEQSALAELANVLANGYWLALHGSLPLNWRTTVPAVVNRVDRIFSLASRIGHYDYLVFHSDFFLPDLNIHLYFCLIPGADCLTRFLAVLDPEGRSPVVQND